MFFQFSYKLMAVTVVCLQWHLFNVLSFNENPVAVKFVQAQMRCWTLSNMLSWISFRSFQILVKWNFSGKKNLNWKYTVCAAWFGLHWTRKCIGCTNLLLFHHFCTAFSRWLSTYISATVFSEMKFFEKCYNLVNVATNTKSAINCRVSRSDVGTSVNS